MAQQGVALNESLPFAHTPLGYIYLLTKQYEETIAEMERAIALDPHFAWGYTSLAVGLSHRVSRASDASGLSLTVG